MNTIGGIIGGLIGGLVGALLWAGISAWTGYEIGWIAWGIGGLVGLGCVKGGKGGGVPVAVIAVVITILSLVAGKYAAVEFILAGQVGNKDEFIQTAIAELDGEDMVISYLADDIIQERFSRGEAVEWPEGVDPIEAAEQADYPPDVWMEAASVWEQMAADEKVAYREQLSEQIRININAWYDEVSMIGFAESFSLMDLIFFGLAVVTAFQIAAKAPPALTRSEFVEAQTG
jgi:hypothetical protein